VGAGEGPARAAGARKGCTGRGWHNAGGAAAGDYPKGGRVALGLAWVGLGLASSVERGAGTDRLRSLPAFFMMQLSTCAPTPQGDGEDEENEAAEGDAEIAVDNGDSALLLLRALAAQDDEVSAKLKGEGGLLATRSCVVM